MELNLTFFNRYSFVVLGSMQTYEMSCTLCGKGEHTQNMAVYVRPVAATQEPSSYPEMPSRSNLANLQSITIPTIEKSKNEDDEEEENLEEGGWW